MVGWFVDTMLVASGLAIVAAVGSRLRSIGPTARHALWLVVLVRLVTPPLLSWPWAAHWGRPRAGPSSQIRPRFRGACHLHRPFAFAVAIVSESAALAVPRPDGRPSTQSRTGFHIVARWRWNEPSTIQMKPIPSPRCHPGPFLKARPRSRMIWAGWRSGWPLEWVLLTVVQGAGQARRIIRFRCRLRAAVPAAGGPGRRGGADRPVSRGAHVPELLVVPDLRTPLVWCLGRPKLLLPAHLVKTLDLNRWRGILIHELAHIRRGDHWVSRLELAAGLIWWWNPIYWLARTRLDAEAELACDAWVVSTLPKDRLAYAEVLFNIFSTMSMARAAGTRVGCRRLGPILREEINHDLARSPLAAGSHRWLS